MTTCLQYVDKELIEGDRISVTFASHTSEPMMFDAIQGHLIDGVGLCPSSVFCDMALTAARYVFAKINPGQLIPKMSIWMLTITHPLIVQAKNPNHIAEVVALATRASDWSVEVSFGSKDESATHEHGACQVRLSGVGDWKNKFSRNLHLVKKRIKHIQSPVRADEVYQILRPIVYKLLPL